MFICLLVGWTGCWDTHDVGYLSVIWYMATGTLKKDAGVTERFAFSKRAHESRIL